MRGGVRRRPSSGPRSARRGSARRRGTARSARRRGRWQYSSPASISPSVRNDSAAIASSPLCSASARARSTVSVPRTGSAPYSQRATAKSAWATAAGSSVRAASCWARVAHSCAAAPLRRGMTEERHRRVGMHELRAGRERLEHVDRLVRHRPGFHTAAGAPQDVREGRERLTLSPDVAPLAIEGGRVSERLDRVVRLIGEVALVRAPREERRHLVGAAGPRRSGARARTGRPPLDVPQRTRRRRPRAVRARARRPCPRPPRRGARGAPARDPPARARGARRARRDADGAHGPEGSTPRRRGGRARAGTRRSSPTETSTPEVMHSSSRASIGPESISTSQVSACGGAIATASSTARASGESRPVRARTASRTVAGISVRRTPAPPSRRTRSRRSSGAAPAGRSRRARPGARRRRARGATAARGGGRPRTRARRP